MNELKIKLQELPDGYQGILLVERNCMTDDAMADLSKSLKGNDINLVVVECDDVDRVRFIPINEIVPKDRKFNGDPDLFKDAFNLLMGKYSDLLIPGHPLETIKDD